LQHCARFLQTARTQAKVKLKKAAAITSAIGITAMQVNDIAVMRKHLMKLHSLMQRQSSFTTEDMQIIDDLKP
jgi:hypothetical protein